MKKKLWMSMCLLACLMVTNTMYAQNNDYKNLVAKRLKAEMGVMASSSLNAMQRICLRKSVDAVKEKHPEMSETQRTILAAELVEKYSQEQVFVDMAEIVTPFYEKCQISIEELKAYEEVAGTERYQNLMKKIGNLSSANVSQYLLEPIKNAAESGTPPEAITPLECSDAYREAFKSVYDKSGMEQVLGQLISTISAGMEQQMQQVDANAAEEEKAFKVMDFLLNYMKDNFEPLMQNLLIEAGVTEDDLIYYVNVLNMPITSKMQAVIQELMGNTDNIMELGAKVENLFSVWLEGQEY